MTSLDNYRNDNPRSAGDIADEIETELQRIRPSAPVVQGTQNYAFIQSVSTALEDTEESLTALYNAGFLTDATGEELTKKARELGVERQPPVAATGIVTFQRNSAATREYVIPRGTVVSTGGADGVSFRTTETASINTGETAATAAVVCTEPGTDGNVGADTIQFLTSGSVSGVDSVTNPQPVGDPSYTLTDNETAQTVGKDREDDESLRERALQSSSIGGAGTAQAAEVALENIQSVISADVVTNRSSTAQNGLSPWHTEVRVYGGELTEIAAVLYETLPLLTLKTLEGGVNGQKETVTLTKPFYGELAVPITRPTVQTIDLTIDVVHTASYGGDRAVREAIVNYVGGETPAQRTVAGTKQGEDVQLNQVENVAEDVQGVEYANVTFVDGDGDGTDDAATDSDGVPIYPVATNTVATVDADTITINTTER